MSRCQKLEDKGLRVLFAGYYKREETIKAQFEETMRENASLQSQLEVFKLLESVEAKALRERIREAQQAVKMQEQKENELQVRYSNLKAKKEQMEKIMASIKGGRQ